MSWAATFSQEENVTNLSLMMKTRKLVGPSIQLFRLPQVKPLAQRITHIDLTHNGHLMPIRTNLRSCGSVATQAED